MLQTMKILKYIQILQIKKILMNYGLKKKIAKKKMKKIKKKIKRKKKKKIMKKKKEK